MYDRVSLLDKRMLGEGEFAGLNQRRAVEPAVGRYPHGSEGSQYALASGRVIVVAVGEHWDPFPGMGQRLRADHSWLGDLGD